MNETIEMPWYINLLGIGMLLAILVTCALGMMSGCEKAEEAPSRYKENDNQWERTNLRCVAGYEFVTYTRSEGAGITQVLNANGGGVPCQVEREP